MVLTSNATSAAQKGVRDMSVITYKQEVHARYQGQALRAYARANTITTTDKVSSVAYLASACLGILAGLACYATMI